MKLKWVLARLINELGLKIHNRIFELKFVKAGAICKK